MVSLGCAQATTPHIALVRELTRMSVIHKCVFVNKASVCARCKRIDAAATYLSLAKAVPTHEMISVPTTIIILACSGYLRKAYSLGSKYENVIQRMAITPATVATMASLLFAFLLMMPKRNSPSMPPAKIPESCHHTSRILVTPIMAIPVKMPNIPKTAVAINSTRRVCLFVLSGLTYRLYISSVNTVAEAFIPELIVL